MNFEDLESKRGQIVADQALSFIDNVIRSVGKIPTTFYLEIDPTRNKIADLAQYNEFYTVIHAVREKIQMPTNGLEPIIEVLTEYGKTEENYNLFSMAQAILDEVSALHIRVQIENAETLHEVETMFPLSLPLYIDTGKTSVEDIRELYLAFNNLYASHGGLGFHFFNTPFLAGEAQAVLAVPVASFRIHQLQDRQGLDYGKDYREHWTPINIVPDQSPPDGSQNIMR